MAQDRPVKARFWPVLAFAVFGCDRAAVPNDVEVVASDYAFAVADTLPAGPARIHYRHAGAVLHEMILGRLREGVRPAEFADSLAHGRKVRALLDGGTAVLFGAPGQSSFPVSIGVTLVRSRHYALWCQFTDGPDKARHMTMGMFKMLEVR